MAISSQYSPARNTREWDISSWVERFMTCIGKIQGPGRRQTIFLESLTTGPRTIQIVSDESVPMVITSYIPD